MRIKQELLERDSEAEFQKAVISRVDACAGIIHVRTKEIQRALVNCRKAALSEGSSYVEWDVVRGFTEYSMGDHRNSLKKGTKAMPQFGQALYDILFNQLDTLSQNRDSFYYFVFNDPEPWWDSPGALPLMRLAAYALPQTSVRFIMVTGDRPPPAPLMDIMSGIQLLPPGFSEMATTAKTLFAQSEGVSVVGEADEENIRALCFSGAGMSVNSFEDVLSLAISENHEKGVVDIEDLIRDVGIGKTNIVNKNDILELYPKEDIENVGGMENLKEWIKFRANCYSDEAADFGIEPPKGMVFVGIPGTGKSLAAKAVASVLRVPLVRLDFGRVFNSLVGSSEERMRDALAMCEHMAPVVLFVDEIDKGLGGIGGGGDSGTSSRVLGTFLSWLNDCTAPVFCMTRDTLVTRSDGVPVCIDQIKDGDEVLSMDWKTGRLVAAEVSATVRPFTKELVTVRTSTTKFKGTPNHPVFVATQEGIREVLLKDLEVGMRIARPRTLRIHKSDVSLSLPELPPISSVREAEGIKAPTVLTKKVAQLLGFLLADGSFVYQDKLNHFRLGFHDKTEEGSKLYAGLVTEVFGTCALHDVAGKQSFYGYLDSGRLGVWFREAFPEMLYGKQERWSPDKIFKASDEIIGSFLRGFFDGDGTCSVGCVSCTGSNDRLITTIGLLLQRLGIAFTRGFYKTHGKKGVHTLTISGSGHLSRFMDLVGFGMPYKQKKLHTCCSKESMSHKPTLIDTCPVMWGSMDRLLEASGVSKSSLGSYLPKRHAGGGVAIWTVQEWLDKTDSEHADHIAMQVVNDIGWDVVMEIEHTEEYTEVYDISVPKHLNFIGNGVVMHNTMVTANNITALPPELMRRGRFDAIFSTGMPTANERLEVLKIHMRKRGWDPKEFPANELNLVVAASKGYVPAEIEAAVKDGLILAFNRDEEFHYTHMIEALKEMVPLSKAYAEQIQAMTLWAHNNATPASIRYDDTESDKVTKLEGRRVRPKKTEE